MSTMTVEAALRAAAAEFMGNREPVEFLSNDALHHIMSTDMLQCSSQWELLEFYGLPLIEDEEYYADTPVPLVLVSLDTPPLVVA